MHNTFLDLRDTLPQGLVEIYRQVQDASTELQLEVLVVGAMARDLVLVHGFGAQLERGTRDIDFAVQVRDWAAFEDLSGALSARGFTRDSQIVHRLHYQTEGGGLWEVDIVPCGSVADELHNIQWPPDGAIEMSTLGFDEAFKGALHVKIGGKVEDFTIKVASPVAMSFLKLISWLEREPNIRKKDAQDLKYLIDTYCKIPAIQNRMYDEGDMESLEWDEPLASARILGRDAAELINQETLKRLQTSLFTQQNKLDLLWIEMSLVYQEVEYKNSKLKVFIDALNSNTEAPLIK